MRLRSLIPLSVLFVVTLAGCEGSSPSAPGDGAQPRWVSDLIAQISSEPVTNPPSSLWSYQYLDQKVYFRPGRCCDIWSDLYDRNGALICHPDGGITGRGDGLCSDFHQVSSEQTLIWQDPR